MLWLVISLLCMAGAFYCWRLGDRWAAQKRNAAPVAVTNQPVVPAVAAPAASVNVTAAPAPAPAPAATVKSNTFLAHRLTNTTRPLKELLHDNNAILLENALIDSTLPANFSIPDHLRLDGDPGSYIVKLRGPLDNAFRAVLAEAGAEFVAYIPNDAVLVRASAAAAGHLKSAGQTQSVLPWEPVYKLKSELLVLGMDNKPLPDGKNLTVILYGDAAEATRAELKRNAVEIISEDRSPFGPIVRQAAGGLAESGADAGRATDGTHPPARSRQRSDPRASHRGLGYAGSDKLFRTHGIERARERE
jgi:hypothetical protein